MSATLAGMVVVVQDVEAAKAHVLKTKTLPQGWNYRATAARKVWNGAYEVQMEVVASGVTVYDFVPVEDAMIDRPILWPKDHLRPSAGTVEVATTLFLIRREDWMATMTRHLSNLASVVSSSAASVRR